MSKWQCPACGLGPFEIDETLGPVRHECVRRDDAKSGPMPGSELKRLLRRMGFEAKADCQCDAHADEMNRNGVQWCKDNVGTITGWMAEEAKKQGLPFVPVVARWIVRQAIRNATAQA